MLHWFLLSGDRALNVCKDIGKSYHKTDSANRVSKVMEVLRRLASIIMDVNSTTLAPAQQVDQAGSAIS